ncbi:MAG: MerR family transcriptional regulator [Actinomycetota bacterium]|nr:MerR family transcriptional regulator [Actinomycetota bacterium]
MARRGDANDETPREGFRGPTVCRTVGITYRQLDYWARTGLVEPSIKSAEGSGSQRLYSFADVVHLKIIKNLLNAGISLQQTRKAIDYLRTELNQPLEDVTLLSDGTTIYAARSRDEVVDLLAQGQGVFGIAVGKVYEELQGQVAELRVGQERGTGDALAKARGG